MQAIGSGVAAFRESLFNADPAGARPGAGRAEWDRWEARCLRYELYTALYQNNSYAETVHAWARGNKEAYGLYKHTRHLLNPAFRSVEFWASHLMGGPLATALPIVSENPEILPSLRRLWRDSNWATGKETWTRGGAMWADAPLKVVEDPIAGRMRLEPVYPGHLKYCQFDSYHNVKNYIIQRWEYDPRVAIPADANPLADPRATMKRVLYTERCWRDGQRVTYETLLDGDPYAWNGVDSSWDRPYGFVPLVVAHHHAIGLDWGMNAFHPGLSRFREVDDLASGLSDQIRKSIRAPMLLIGVKEAGGIERGRRTGRPDGAAAGPDQSDREQLDFLHAGIGGDAKHLTFDLNIRGVFQYIRELNADIDKNFPELLADTGNLAGAVTATAMKMLRQRASAKVRAVRPGYDAALARAHGMALAIGGSLGFPGYDGFDLGSYARGDLDHAIGDRPVFDVDAKDAIDEDAAFWAAAESAGKAGFPLALYLRRNGWSEAEIAEYEAAKAGATAAHPISQP